MGLMVRLLMQLLAQEEHCGVHRGIQFWATRCPTGQETRCRCKGIWVPGALSAEMPPTCAEKVLLASQDGLFIFGVGFFSL